MALLHRTKDNSPPSGKPKVFFTCHPQDWDAWFLPVCEDLFQFCNCAVYYDDPENPSPRDNDYDARLRGMNLMVIPVTAVFLSHPSPALDHDFRYAMEHHIPILPLVQEPGLDKLFAQKCGNLQYLDKTLRSATAIPYEEKLAQFLKGVLLDDDMVQKIRSHFDGYVFLSYRKKDRRYIRELMKLIHSFPQFRDIALWYDEYLTPGEDFNDEIQTHLNDSKLFAMIVTPNLVNEKNYVQEYEYPQAMKQEKPVVPIQYEPTDGDSLRRDYPDIPDCLDPADTAGVEAALDRTLAGFALRYNDTDPVHCYHIGLAYLTGTDVEVDLDLALQLITQAAEAGLTEAMEKLADMYRTGEGVAFDPNRAIFWLERLVDAAEARFDASGNLEDAVFHHACLRKAANCCILMDQLSSAKMFAISLLDAAQALWDSGQYNQIPLIEAAEMNALISDIQGDAYDAVDWFTTALELRQELCGDPARIGTKPLRELIEACQKMGDLYLEIQDLSLAQQHYRQAIEYTGLIPKRSMNIPQRTRLAELYQSLGDLYVLQENFDNAEKEYLTALELAKAIAGDTGDDRILITHYQGLGKLGDHRGRLTSGRKYWKQALEIARQRDERKSTDQTQADLSGCYLHLGVSYYTNWVMRLRNVIRAKSQPLLEKGLEIRRALDQKQRTYHSRLMVHTALVGLSELYVNMDFFREAESHCLEQLAISKQLLKEMDTPDNRLLVAYDLGLLAKVYTELKQTEKATRYAQKQYDILNGMAEEIGTSEVWDDLASASYELALLTRSGQKMAYAAAIWHALAEEYPDIPIYARREQEAREWLPE